MARSITLPHLFAPRDYQRPIMRAFDNGAKRAWWCVHRRGGKDRTMLAQTSKMAFERVGLYWHMLPTLKQARKAVWDNITNDGLKLIGATFPESIRERGRTGGIREDEMKLTLANGSIVQLMGADNFDSNVGANPVHITFSEFALQHPRGWHLMRPILTENDGTAAFISTPRGYNHFHELGEAAKLDKTGRWYHDIMDILRTGRMTREQVAQEIAEGMPENLARQEYYCDFSAANVGAILGAWMEAAMKEGRIVEGLTRDHMGAGLELSCDLGFNDTCAWWLWQRLPGGWYALLGYDEDNGLDAQDWLERFDKNGWTKHLIETVWMPHDAKAKTFATKTSAFEQFRAAGYNAQLVPLVSVNHRINAARKVARRCVWASEACANGLRALRDWQYAYDEERRVYSQKPDHNWASHGSDAFSYGALAMNPREIEREAKPENKPVATPVHNAFALDDIWDTAPQVHIERL